MTPKELKQLANACRQAGIKHFKQGDIEFTLTDELPSKRQYKRKDAPKDLQDPLTGFQSDAPSPEQLLYWSAQGGPDESQPN